LFVGVADISLSDLLKSDAETILLFSISRIPRTVALILAGVGLSVCGLIMQQMTQNKFVSPTTAGTLDATKMGLLAALIFFPSVGFMGKMIFAFLFTFFASLLFLKIIQKIRFRNVVFVPLVGLGVGGIVNSISTFVAVRLNIVKGTNERMVVDGWFLYCFARSL